MLLIRVSNWLQSIEIKTNHNMAICRQVKERRSFFLKFLFAASRTVAQDFALQRSCHLPTPSAALNQLDVVTRGAPGDVTS